MIPSSADIKNLVEHATLFSGSWTHNQNRTQTYSVFTVQHIILLLSENLYFQIMLKWGFLSRVYCILDFVYDLVGKNCTVLSEGKILLCVCLFFISFLFYFTLCTVINQATTKQPNPAPCHYHLALGTERWESGTNSPRATFPEQLSSPFSSCSLLLTITHYCSLLLTVPHYCSLLSTIAVAIAAGKLGTCENTVTFEEERGTWGQIRELILETNSLGLRVELRPQKGVWGISPWSTLPLFPTYPKYFEIYSHLEFG